MRLISRGKHRFTVRPSGRAISYFRAIAAVSIVIASMAPLESRAAITLNSRGGLTHVEGQLLGNHWDGGDPPMLIQDNTNGYDVVKQAPAGLGSFTLPGVPPAGTTTIPGASSVTNANIQATITLDTLADTLSVTSSGSVSAVVSGTFNSERRDIAVAEGDANFFLSFSIDREYDYAIASSLSVGAQEFGPFAGQAHAESTIDLGVFHQNRIFNCEDCDFVGGSLTGTLEPGGHSLNGSVRVGPNLNSISATSATANYNFSFSLTPAPPSHRWIDPSGGLFHVNSKWDDAIVPGSQDAAVFDLPGTYTVQLDQDTTNKRLRANGAGTNFTFDLNGSEYVADEIIVGGRPGDNVSVTFGDSNPPVVAAAAVAPGGFANAAANGTAERRLRAALLKAGKGGTADVTIPIATTRGRIDVGGRVNVTGAKGNWDVNNFLLVGVGGFAELFIENRAIVDAFAINIGLGDGGSGYVEVSDATLLQRGPTGLSVGDSGPATLAVKNKGLVDVQALSIGILPLGDGRVTVESLGQLRVNESLLVSAQGPDLGGNAKLIINGGSATRTGGSGHTKIAPKGVLEVLKGHFHEAHELTVNGTLAIDRTDGSASVGTNPVNFVGKLTIASGGTLKGNGIIKGKVKVIGSGTNEFAGQTLPGLSPGTLTIDGDYEQEGGLLGIEIAGTAPGQFDVLAVTGSATVGGDLLLEFIDGFAPRQGDVFNFLDVGGSLSGAFANVEVRNLLPGFQFDFRSDGGGLTMVALNDGVFVPEPATLAMLFAGMLVTLFRRGGVGTVERRGVAV
jgi:T5SS/PEP-CTERM-associated repeat protein